jgi:D-alanine-D-alanine ligase
MSQPTHAVVIGGGLSGEHSVSVASARDISQALREGGFRVTELLLERDGGWTCVQDLSFGGTLADAVAALQAADVAVPALHGRHGEDGTLAAVLDLVGIPYVGASVWAGAVGIDKYTTKLLCADAGIAVAPGLLVDRPGDPRLSELSLPLVVKPNSGGSSLGLSLVRTRDELFHAVRQALQDDDRALVEPFVRGMEVDVGVLETAEGSIFCSEPLEIMVDSDGLFDTEAKYEHEPPFRIPADVPAHIRGRLQATARTVFDVLRCRGLARVDFFVDGDEIVLNEVNTMPGFTARSQFPRMFLEAGIGYTQLVTGLVDRALADSRARKPTEWAL